MSVMWNLILVRLETVLVSLQDRCMVCAKRPIGSEIVLDSPNGANLDARKVHGLRRTYHGLINRFGGTRWNSQVTSMESRFGPFGDCQCRCKIGAWLAPNVLQAQKSFWTHPIELLGDEAQVVAHFGPFGDSLILTQDRCMVCTKHTIGSDIVQDAPDGTLR